MKTNTKKTKTDTKKSYKDRYEKIAKSNWFKRSSPHFSTFAIKCFSESFEN